MGNLAESFPNDKMGSSIRSLIQSPLFTFTIDSPDGPKDFQIHSAVIAKISPVLKAMMDSLMSEGVSKHATLYNVDLDSFEKLCEYAYSGDFAKTPHKCTVCSPLAGKVRVPLELARNAEPIEKFSGMKYPTSHLSDWDYPCFQSKFDYAPIFFDHAKLYSIARFYMCEGLCSLILQKTHAMLVKFPITGLAAVNTIVTLIERVYDDEYLDDAGEKIDQLRYLVTVYAADKMQELALAPPFLDLLEKGGSFVRLYWKVVCVKSNGNSLRRWPSVLD